MSKGKINDFDVKTGNWTLYVERLEMMFKVNDTADDLKLPTLIASMGDGAYELLSNLTSPVKPSEKSYAEVVETMRNHLEPKASFMAERYRFRQRRQLQGEPILQYVTELKKLAKNCEFGSVLEDNLRDQLVCGLRCDQIRQRLFAKNDLKYSNAVRLACAMEAAERDAAAVEHEETAAGAGASSSSGDATTLHAVTSVGVRRGRGRQYTPVWRDRGSTYCDVCGADNHRGNQCRFKDYICGKCKQKGHLRRVCPKRAGGASAKASYKRGMHHVYAARPDGNGAGGPGGRSNEEDTQSEGSGSEVELELNQLCLDSYKPV